MAEHARALGKPAAAFAIVDRLSVLRESQAGPAVGKARYATVPGR